MEDMNKAPRDTNLQVVDQKSLAPADWLNFLRASNGYTDIRFGDVEERSALIKCSGIANTEKDIQEILNLTDYERDDKAIATVLRWMGFNKEKSNTAKNIFIGVFPNKDIRGRVAKSPRGDKVIFLHANLPDIARFICCFPPFDTNTGKMKILADDDPVLLNFLCVVGRCWEPDLRTVICDPLILLRMSDEVWRRVECMWLSCLSFIVGHELGHAINNHAYTEVYSENCQIEYEADRYGFDTWLATINLHCMRIPEKLLLSILIGPYISLMIIAMVPQREDDDKHPPVSDRLAQLNSQIRSKFKFSISRDAWNRLQKVMGHQVDQNLIILGQKIFEQGTRYKGIVKQIAERAFPTTRPCSIESLYGRRPDAVFRAISPLKSTLPEEIAAYEKACTELCNIREALIRDSEN